MSPTLPDYDEVPYEGACYRATHPDHLQAFARLHGLEPAPVEGWRVLELGCGPGHNLMPMAASLPGAQFVGVDLSREHIRIGQALQDLTGLQNLELRHGSILDVDADWGLFDAILCHGVYSWVPPDVQQAILRIGRQNLTAAGIVYVSYNVLPGWYDRLPAREFMMRMAAGKETTRARVLAARNALARLAGGVPEDDPQHEVLTRLDRSLTGMSDAYILHEYLSPDNAPVHFGDFLERAAEEGLGWLCEAAPLWGHRFHEDALPLLEVDPIERQCRHDYLRNRMFRATLLTPSENEVNHLPTWERLRDGFEVSSAFSIQDEGGFRIGDEDEDCWLPIADEGVQRALRLLEEDHSRLWPLTELAQASSVEEEVLGPALLEVFDYGILELRDRPRRCTTVVSEKPEACSYARTLAAQGADKLVSRAHLQVRVEDLEQVLLPLMDGTRTHDELRTAVLHIMSRGRYDLDWKGELMVSDKLRDNVTDLVAAMLKRLVGLGLLVG